MKVLHINTKDQGGGAARAMQRLHDQLKAQGHESRFLVGRTERDHPEVDVVADVVSEYRSFGDRFLSILGNRFKDLWGIHPWMYRPTLKLPKTDIFQWADILDLRNLFSGYFNLWVLPELTENKSVVWRLPDMWALTGHCAYPYDCQRWISGCYDCPLLTKEGKKIVNPKPTRWDGTKRVWREKRDIYAKSKLHIVINSQWMKENVERSILRNALSIHVISNGVDLDMYQPYHREKVRRELDLPQDRKILFFSAANIDSHRKGYPYAYEAVSQLRQRMQNPPLLITMGHVKDQETNLWIRHYGYVKDAALQAKLYAAADLYLCTTLADAQPQTALESIACGTPVIGFDIRPMADIVEHEKRGLIVDDISSTALRRTIESVIDRQDWIAAMGENCRRKAVRDFDIVKQTSQYIDLYEQILGDETP
jgi:glycosyltransferase involved in cell wall biosynthesis